MYRQPDLIFSDRFAVIACDKPVDGFIINVFADKSAGAIAQQNLCASDMETEGIGSTTVTVHRAVTTIRGDTVVAVTTQ